jgi:flagellin-like hook-associated protein FlgL
LLRNAALASLESKKELEKIRDRDVDIKRFEDSLDEFKKTFGYNCDQSDKRLDEAIKDIDKAITNLNNIRASILASKRQMRIASDKLNNVTIEKPQC